jgi:hypothetical protein
MVPGLPCRPAAHPSRPHPRARRPSPAAGAGAAGDKATAKLLGAALGGDVELAEGLGISAGYAPRWMQASEGIRGEMLVLRERIAKLRE